ncbi:MAG TPA: hypothetical protein PLS03_08905 [Terrimicrobiaceae bacterium]|nr:hypothetical protein [Terrimicrobiaceae bacterium]
MQRIWKVAGILALVWLAAGAVIWFSRASRPTPESLAAYIAKHPLEGLAEARRAEVIGRAADQVNRLNFDQRQELRKLGADREFFRAMTPDERKRFLDLTMPEGFRQLMIALNKMDPAKRKKLVQRALDDIERDTPEINERIDRAEVQKMISQGVGSFYEEANADVKLEFAPVIERLQRATQNLR